MTSSSHYSTLWEKPSPEEQQRVRAHILAGTCPWCNAVPRNKTGRYKILANHTNAAHGIDKYELRRLGGYKIADSVCDPEISAKHADRCERLGPERRREIAVTASRAAGNLGGQTLKALSQQWTDAQRTAFFASPRRHSLSVEQLLKMSERYAQRSIELAERARRMSSA